ncbi:MAG: hypothetical protein RI513_04345 [Balneolaceae bacterium]|nr:hypothetical protein [Balneolaceae bacterium]MDR9447169.1 hypothetical protein [Balneolaceae bacterium]
MIRWLLIGLLIYMLYRMIRGMIFISTVQKEAQKHAQRQARNRAQSQARNRAGQQRSTSVKDRLHSIEEADFEEVDPDQTQQDKT